MTTQEIKDLVAAKIAGQGSMVDAGGALPTILNAIVDAIDAITPGEILSFAEPLKKSGTDVSLQYGSGLEKDDDTLAVKLAENGGLIAGVGGIALDADEAKGFMADANGAGLSPSLLRETEFSTFELDETEHENLTGAAILSYPYQSGYRYAIKINGQNLITLAINNLPEGYTLGALNGVWVDSMSYNSDGSLDGANIIFVLAAVDADYNTHFMQIALDV